MFEDFNPLIYFALVEMNGCNWSEDEGQITSLVEERLLHCKCDFSKLYIKQVCKIKFEFFLHQNVFFKGPFTTRTINQGILFILAHTAVISSAALNP